VYCTASFAEPATGTRLCVEEHACVCLQLLRRLLRAGVPVNIGDYDKRTALHISAAEGNAVMVSCQEHLFSHNLQSLC
jgi:ankyrin repeat protein